MTFELDEKQSRKVTRWQNTLLKDEANCGAIGGRFTYSITPTGLGLIVKVIDNVTKKELDVTDYENW